MKTRVIVALLLLPLLFIVLYFTPPWVLPLTLSLMSMLAVHELLGITDFVRKRRIMVYALAFTGAVPIFEYFDPPGELMLLGTFVFVVLLFAEGLFDHKNITFEIVGGTFTASLIIPSFFSSAMRIMEMENGKFIVLFAVIIPVMTDIFAMLTGMLFGKTRLLPEISPKKTVEGCVGGIIFAVIFSLVYGLILRFAFGFYVDYLVILLLAVVGSIAGQLGDLAFSYIKRGFKVKDFGAIFPGHGGVLDRFDSLLFVAPLAEVTLTVFAVIWK
ncbi:MAG: phosphatidate cytidylyltransferase [Oscillospiraceae bacterium]|nr:phosphatidate cytidylyltransferase [Oscillospiraceae bacterium]